MKDILIRFDAAEALTALGAIQDKALDASRLAAISSGDEHEIADLSAKILRRLATRLTDAIYPEPTWDEMRRQDLRDEVELGLV